MPTYKISANVSYDVVFTVDAGDENSAEDRAIGQLEDGMHMNIADLMDLDIYDIEEVEP